MTGSACGKCGAPRPPDSFPGGLCPACLLSAALSDTSLLDVSGDERDGLPPGTTFGPFLIRRQLGRGGMAAVYDALDTRLERAIALKVLPPEFLHDETSGRRFEIEARLIARLEHPNIVPVYASGIEAGIPWMSMRLLTGNNLSVLLRQRRLTPIEVVQLLRPVAAALDYAHARGVVHRDIKPANILLDASGVACVADFGLAQMLESGDRLTQTGILTGTPHYMAPEQALGKRVDHRCDIYSLGIVAYEMLAGTTPFTAESPVAVLLQHVQEPLPAPADRVSGAHWMDAIHKAAAKNPADRWPSAGAFLDALESSIGSAPVNADSRTRSRSEPLRRWRRTLWTAAAGGAVVAAAAAMWMAVQQARSVRGQTPSSAAVSATGEVARPASAAPGSTPNSAAQTSRVTRAAPPRTPADRTRPAVLASEAPSPQPSAESAAAGAPHTSGAPAVPVIVEGPLVLEPLTRLSPAAAPAPPVAEVFTAPEIVRDVKPPYPAAAAAADLQGDVVLAGVVGIDGKVTHVTVERSVHPLLDEAARKAWLQCQYKPARRNGIPEPARLRRTFTFQLQ